MPISEGVEIHPPPISHFTFAPEAHGSLLSTIYSYKYCAPLLLAQGVVAFSKAQWKGMFRCISTSPQLNLLFKFWSSIAVASTVHNAKLCLLHNIKAGLEYCNGRLVNGRFACAKCTGSKRVDTIALFPLRK